MTFLTSIVPVVHIMSTLSVMPLTVVALHCNIKVCSIIGVSVVVTSTNTEESTKSCKNTSNYQKNNMALDRIAIHCKALNKP